VEKRGFLGNWFSWNNFPCMGLDIAHNILFGELLYSRIEQDRFALMNRCLTENSAYFWLKPWKNVVFLE